MRSFLPLLTCFLKPPSCPLGNGTIMPLVELLLDELEELLELDDELLDKE